MFFFPRMSCVSHESNLMSASYWSHFFNLFFDIWKATYFSYLSKSFRFRQKDAKTTFSYVLYIYARILERTTGDGGRLKLVTDKLWSS